MRNTIIVSLALCLIVTGAASQELIGTVGISFQKLQDLKANQRYVAGNNYIRLTPTQSFPPYLQYQFGVRFLVTPKVKLGGTMYLTSTAGRSVTSDYTGSVTLDEKLWCLGGGGYFAYVLHQQQRWNIAVYAITGMDVSSLKTTYSVLLSGAERYHEESKDAAISAALEGGLEFQCNINDRFAFHANAGFHAGAPAQLNDEYDTEVLTINWTGAKVMAGICFRL